VTINEVEQKLAIEKLAKTGTGLVSPTTFDEIARALVPDPQIASNEISTDHLAELTFKGIILIKNPFVPDGEIWPFEKWNLKPAKVHLSVIGHWWSTDNL
jgi:hypothetical protein